MDHREININDEVLVKLTDRGKAILKKKNDYAKAAYPQLQHATSDFAPFIEEKGGWYSCQLWEIMYVFGNHLGIGFDLPFETTIRIVMEG